ncbi:hypothetical protein KUTeg_024380 [Tegillarca granosa]|uniref:hydroxyisourate hydrolase n=1 Tax=Tegillarca granosa TaxID=220873 RepID=A0ABQ9DXQ4_TEGGR|nr:hypothetical protein KUTeg_024380 [Tegillarca granosa]
MSSTAASRISILTEHLAQPQQVKVPVKVEFTTEYISVLINIYHLNMSGEMARPPLTTHVLDTARGHPAGGLAFELYERTVVGEFKKIESGATNEDGRGGFLLGSQLKAGTVYKIYFDTESYFAKIGSKGLSHLFEITGRGIQIVFRVDDPNHHYHVPLLLSNYGYSTYRGS